MRFQELQGELDGVEQELADAQAALASAAAARDAALQARDSALADRDAAVEERDAAQAQAQALRADIGDLQGEVASLSEQLTELEREAARLEAAAATLQTENARLTTTNTELATTNEQLAGSNVQLEQLNENLRVEIRESSQTVRDLEAKVDELEQHLEVTSLELTQTRQEFDRVTDGDVTFRANQIIYAGAIEAKETGQVREALAEFVRAANQETARNGAGDVRLSAEQIDSLVEYVRESPGAVVIRLISPRNQFSPVEVEVVVEALENTQLIDRGRLVTSRQIHLGSDALPASQAELRSALARLKSDALTQLLRQGLELRDIQWSPSDESFTNQLLRLTGPVSIGAVATEPVFRAGPAQLQLVILH